MPNYVCPECKNECTTYVDDQRFDAFAPNGGSKLYGEAYLVSNCCDATLEDDGADEYEDFDDFDLDDFVY